jgi:hypothetical protein
MACRGEMKAKKSVCMELAGRWTVVQSKKQAAVELAQERGQGQPELDLDLQLLFARRSSEYMLGKEMCDILLLCQVPDKIDTPIR